MTITDQNRTYFEAVGYTEVRCELVVGSVTYLGLDADRRRIEAREWVAEQRAMISKEKADAIHRERRTLEISTWTLIGKRSLFRRDRRRAGRHRPPSWSPCCTKRITYAKRLHRNFHCNLKPFSASYLTSSLTLANIFAML
jgi:hypothetical protein